MCLPRWKMIGHEERDPTTLQALQLGYPRFLIHPYVLQLAKLNPDRSGCTPFPTAAGANRHCSFLQKQYTNEAIDVVNVTKSILFFIQISVPILPSRLAIPGEGLTSRHEALLMWNPFPILNLAAKIRHQLSAYTQTDPNQIVLFPNGMAALRSSAHFKSSSRVKALLSLDFLMEIHSIA